jgi:hypothetical protein
MGLALWAARVVGEEDDALQVEAASGRVSKQGVVYLHVYPDHQGSRQPLSTGYQTQYECRDCPSWISDTRRCIAHGPDVEILATGSCSFWLYGQPKLSAQAKPLDFITPIQSGYQNNPAGAGWSCKRCRHFVAKCDEQGRLSEQGGCDLVDFRTDGDDPGMIHPDACCNANELDTMLGAVATADFGVR